MIYLNKHHCQQPTQEENAKKMMKLKIVESAAVENVESGVQNENEVMPDDDVSSLHSFDSFPPTVEGDLNEESFELIKLDCGENEDKPEQCCNGTLEVIQMDSDSEFETAVPSEGRESVVASSMW